MGALSKGSGDLKCPWFKGKSIAARERLMA
jgi:uncharacterized protein YodC (DUF2158 family)